MKKKSKIVTSVSLLSLLLWCFISLNDSHANELSEANITALTDATGIHIFCRSKFFANCYSADGVCEYWVSYDWHCFVSGYKNGINPNY
jgi:hypothetical protein